VSSRLDPRQQRLGQRIVDALRGERAVAAMALGGSFARGHATAASDIDLVLFYDETQPPEPARLNDIVAALAPDATPTFTRTGEWGPWVNGGAWLSFSGQRVDVLYRSLQQCQRVLDDCTEGRWELHWAQQPPYGYFSGAMLLHHVAGNPTWDRPLPKNIVEVARLLLEQGADADAFELIRRGIRLNVNARLRTRAGDVGEGAIIHEQPID